MSHSQSSRFTSCLVFRTALLLLVLALTACSSSDDVETYPKVRFVDCPFDASFNVSNMKCGELDTYENYAKTGPNDRIIQLAFGILPAKSEPVAPDPVVVFTGGPSFSPLVEYALFNENELFTENRELILVDQRGVGFSKPFLKCGILDSRVSDAIAKECIDEFVMEGVELSEYRSKVTARDFKELRLALDIEQWNVYGASYGPIPGIMYAELDPEGIRSLIFDSSTDNQVDIAVADAAVPLDLITELANQCAAETTCSERLSDVRSTFIDTYRSLTNDPWVFEIPDEGEVELTGIDFFYIVTDEAPVFMPGLLEGFAKRDTELFLKLIEKSNQNNEGDEGFSAEQEKLLERIFADLAHTTVQCAAIDAENFPTAIIPTKEQWPDDLLAVARDRVGYPSACTRGIISIDQDLTQREPITTDLPTLLLGGALDNAVALMQVEKFTESFVSPTVAIAPKGGHVIGYPAMNDCVGTIVESFINNPTVSTDVSCITVDVEPFLFDQELIDNF